MSGGLIMHSDIQCCSEIERLYATVCDSLLVINSRIGLQVVWLSFWLDYNALQHRSTALVA